MKALFISAMLAMPVCASAGNFGWNKGIDANIGYAYVHSPFGSDSFGNKMPTDLINVDVSCYGLYASVAGGKRKTGYNVYGYDESITAFIIKFGTSLRYRINDNAKFLFIPYAGYGYYTVDDESNNAIGQRQDYGMRKASFVIGSKFSFAYKNFMVGAFASNIDAGVTIGINLDFD